MGCQQSSGTNKIYRVFGENGLHVGRDGDVDLTSRSLDVFEPRFVELIKRDRLHTARRIHLSENKLYTLGKEITRLPDIEKLYINSNRFERLPVVLGEMKRLEVLDASRNPLGHQNRSLHVLPRIANLSNLVLRGCSLTTLPPCLLECVTLQELDLSENSHLQLADVDFSRLHALRSLAIANCGICGELPLGIKMISTLEVLDISRNRFQFDTPDFFGDRLAASLAELYLRAMGLKAVPQVVVSLRKLSYLDLAENAIETLDVLAGRLVRKLTSRNTVCGGSSNAVAEMNEDNVSVVSHASTRLSVSQLSRAGRIAYVAQPIPLKKLSLRACGLRTVPKYFHKLTGLIDIDLSENELLDDPNLTFFSFGNLQVLSVVGCPFSMNRCTARNEWFDIAKLRNLHTINWEVWKGVRNMSPYRTKVPLEICGLRLQYINGIKLRPGLFVGDTVQTAINLLSDGYFKVDLALDEDLVYSHAEAVHALNPLKSFFFAETSGNSAGNGGGGGGGGAAPRGGTSPPRSTQRGSSSMLHPRSEVLQIVINRYIFFLSMQAANYDTVIIPPADVMAIHYAQMTQDPIRYRSDCEAICGQVLSCNYHLFFFENKMRPHAVKDALNGSRRVWNMMVRTTQKDLLWLRYEFWERRSKEGTAAAAVAATVPVPVPVPVPVASAAAAEVSTAPAAPPCGRDCSDEIGDLQGVDSVTDLCAVLDRSITSHFMEQGVERFVYSLEHFFHANRQFLEHEELLRAQPLDWTRYAKYLALYAHAQRLKQPEKYKKHVNNLVEEMPNFSLVSPDAYLPRPLALELELPTGPRRSTSAIKGKNTPVDPVGDKGAASDNPCGGLRPSAQRSISTHTTNGDAGGGGGSRRQNQLLHTSEPVPTIGLTLLLHSHRTAHAKYYQTLGLLGIENVDVVWEDTRAAVGATMKLWMSLYNEHYVEDMNTAFVTRDSQPLQREADAPQQQQQQQQQQGGSRGTFQRAGVKRIPRSQRRVTLCSSSAVYSIM